MNAFAEMELADLRDEAADADVASIIAYALTIRSRHASVYDAIREAGSTLRLGLSRTLEARDRVVSRFLDTNGERSNWSAAEAVLAACREAA